MSSILVIDDEPAIVETVAELLTWEGHTVLTAYDGAQGLDELRRSAKVDVVILDFMVPVKVRRASGEAVLGRRATRRYRSRAEGVDRAHRTARGTRWIRRAPALGKRLSYPPIKWLRFQLLASGMGTALPALMRLALLLLSISVGLAACAAPEGADPEEAASAEAEIVGGSRDLRWSASGYLLKGSSMEGLDRSKPACGATLIAPDVAVTAAHCVLDQSATFAFGTGDVGTGPLVRVKERRAHPKFHAEAQGSIDLVHALRKYDVGVLVLERAVQGVTPAQLPDEKPSLGCNLRAIGYHADAAGAPSLRRSAPACTMLRATLGTDPIFEVHPRGRAALCHADGDEGSSVFDESPDKSVLRGIYVGSVTQGFTDCRGGTQYLNGYESAYGYRDFLREQIASVATGTR